MFRMYGHTRACICMCQFMCVLIWDGMPPYYDVPPFEMNNKMKYLCKLKYFSLPK